VVALIADHLLVGEIAFCICLSLIIAQYEIAASVTSHVVRVRDFTFPPL
jgi:hypothetical protein